MARSLPRCDTGRLTSVVIVWAHKFVAIKFDATIKIAQMKVVFFLFVRVAEEAICALKQKKVLIFIFLVQSSFLSLVFG